MPDDGEPPLLPDAAVWLVRPGAGLLLDLDGTLLDSEPVHQAVYREYFARRGWRVPADVRRQFSGRRGAEVFATLEGPWTGEDADKLTEEVLELLRGSPRRPEPVAGAVRLIAACVRVGLPTVIVTSAGLEWAVPALDVLGTERGALAMVTAEDCTSGKPDPEPFRRGVELLGLRAETLVAVEDSPAGIASALGAGVGRVLGVTTTRGADELLAAGATATAPDLVELARAVEALAAARG